MVHARNDIDWLACELIEQVPGKVSGRFVVRGTRIFPDVIVNSYDAGCSRRNMYFGTTALRRVAMKI